MVDNGCVSLHLGQGGCLLGALNKGVPRLLIDMAHTHTHTNTHTHTYTLFSSAHIRNALALRLFQSSSVSSLCFSLHFTPLPPPPSPPPLPPRSSYRIYYPLISHTSSP